MFIGQRNRRQETRLGLCLGEMTGTCFDPITNYVFSMTYEFSEDGFSIYLFIQNSKNRTCSVIKLVPWKVFILYSKYKIKCNF